MGCTRCSGTGSVGYLPHASMMFDEFTRRPMQVTSTRATHIVADWAARQPGVIGRLAVAAISRITDVQCPDCVNAELRLEQTGPDQPDA